jgi:hypothetical protein
MATYRMVDGRYCVMVRLGGRTLQGLEPSALWLSAMLAPGNTTFSICNTY